MNKKNILNIVVWVLLVSLIAISALNSYLLLNPDKNWLSHEIQSSVEKEISKITFNQPKDALDGHTPIKGVDYHDGSNATDDQVKQAVIEWFKKNPPQVINGTNGANGVSGESAYQSWLKLGNEGTEQDFIDSLKAPPAIDGKTPQISCNVIKNRWEVRYSEYESWNILNGKITKCIGV